MKAKSFLMVCTLVVFFFIETSGQVSVNNNSAPPDNSAMLDVQSTEKGMLVPRMTMAQRDLIEDPATGLVIFQTDNTPGLIWTR
jgi:hypothetical protein